MQTNLLGCSPSSSRSDPPRRCPAAHSFGVLDQSSVFVVRERGICIRSSSRFADLSRSSADHPIAIKENHIHGMGASSDCPAMSSLLRSQERRARAVVRRRCQHPHRVGRQCEHRDAARPDLLLGSRFSPRKQRQPFADIRALVGALSPLLRPAASFSYPRRPFHPAPPISTSTRCSRPSSRSEMTRSAARAPSTRTRRTSRPPPPLFLTWI